MIINKGTDEEHSGIVCSCGHYEYLHFGGFNNQCVASPGGKQCKCQHFNKESQ